MTAAPCPRCGGEIGAERRECAECGSREHAACAGPACSVCGAAGFGSRPREELSADSGTARAQIVTEREEPGPAPAAPFEFACSVRSVAVTGLVIIAMSTVGVSLLAGQTFGWVGEDGLSFAVFLGAGAGFILGLLLHAVLFTSTCHVDPAAGTATIEHRALRWLCHTRIIPASAVREVLLELVPQTRTAEDGSRTSSLASAITLRLERETVLLAVKITGSEPGEPGQPRELARQIAASLRVPLVVEAHAPVDASPPLP